MESLVYHYPKPPTKHGLKKRAHPWARVQLEFFEKVVLKREVIFHRSVSRQGGLSLGSPLIRLVCHGVTSVTVVSYWGHLTSGWSVIGVTSQLGLSLGSSLIRVVCH